MTNTTTELENLMYEIMSKLQKSNVPVVFKGALITKLVLGENNYTELSRKTQDIDMNWVGTLPSMEEMRVSIEQAINSGESKDRYRVDVKRNYGDGKSAGFVIVSLQTGERITKMDVDIRKYEHGYREYFVGNATFYGVTPNQIVCDKIAAISGDKVFRRAKDIVDLYALSQCVATTAEEIGETARKNGRVFGSFDSFLGRKADIEHAYNKLGGVENKPSFETVYSHVAKFIQPFIGGTLDYTWNPQKESWEQEERANYNSSGQIWVRPHMRNGKPVKGHWRKKRKA